MNIEKIVILLFLVINVYATEESYYEIERDNYTEAWKAYSIEETIEALYDEKNITLETTTKIEVTLPQIAEYSAVVPIKIESKILLESMAIMQEIKGEKSLIAFIKFPKAKKMKNALRLAFPDGAYGKIVTVSKGVFGKFYKTVNHLKCSARSYDFEINYTKEQIESLRHDLEKPIKYRLVLKKKKKQIFFMVNLLTLNYKQAKASALPPSFVTFINIRQKDITIVDFYLSPYLSTSFFVGFSSVGVDKEEPLEILMESINGEVIGIESEIDGKIKKF